MLFDIPNAHGCDVTCVDMNLDIFVTGSRDKSFKIWQMLDENLVCPNVYKGVEIGDKIWSLGLSPKSLQIAIGSAGYEKITPLHIFDLHR